eukprot:3463988-Rhodomonas_salina.1
MKRAGSEWMERAEQDSRTADGDRHVNISLILCLRAAQKEDGDSESRLRRGCKNQGAGAERRGSLRAA